MNKTSFIGVLFLSMSLLLGCTKENLDECFSGLRLDFDFTLHTNDNNLFGEKVQRVRVYLFDQDDVLQLYAIDNGTKLEYSFLQGEEIKTVTKSNPYGALPNEYVMELDQVPPGKYRIMSWAGSGMGDNTTFFHGHMNDPVTHNFKDDVTLGITKMADFRMFLKYNYAPDLPEDIVPTVDEIDDLWYGAVGKRNEKTSVYTFDNVEVKSGATTQRHIELIRNTNILKITVSGIKNLNLALKQSPVITRQAQVLAETQFKVWVTSRNGRYRFDNSIGEYARSIRYTPHYAVVSPDTILADVKVLRLDMERHTAEPMLLYLEAPDGRRFPNKPIDVVNTLLQARDPNTGEYIYNSQSDFDKIYEHPVEVRIGVNLEVRIFIGKWEIVNIKPA